MRRRVENWSIEKLQKSRPLISFPEYQRQPNLWSTEKKRLLIDSILADIDIPKLYFNKTGRGSYEVVDGTQRLWAIWEFVDDRFALTSQIRRGRFSDLSSPDRATIWNYQLQIAVLEDAADDYLRELFVRLQLGLLLVTGEKLNAATGKMKGFVFDRMAKHNFLQEVGIPNRRFAKPTLGAQIAINSFARAKIEAFARTRYEDLIFFFKEYADPKGEDFRFFNGQTARILERLDGLGRLFGSRAKDLRNRSYILSVYLLYEDLVPELNTPKAQRTFVSFVFELWARLKQEAKAGIDRTNRELYAFETMLSSAPGERYQIERRHQEMLMYFEFFKAHGKIKGDQ